MSRITSGNNIYRENVTKTGSSFRASDPAMNDILNDVLKPRRFYDYQSEEGDSLSLSSASKAQITQGELLTKAQTLSNPDNSPMENTANNQSQTHMQKQTQPLPVSDSVKSFFQKNSVHDIQKMSSDQIPNDVKSFLQKLSTDGILG